MENEQKNFWTAMCIDHEFTMAQLLLSFVKDEECDVIVNYFKLYYIYRSLAFIHLITSYQWLELKLLGWQQSEIIMCWNINYYWNHHICLNRGDIIEGSVEAENFYRISIRNLTPPRPVPSLPFSPLNSSLNRSRSRAHLSLGRGLNRESCNIFKKGTLKSKSSISMYITHIDSAQIWLRKKMRAKRAQKPNMSASRIEAICWTNIKSSTINKNCNNKRVQKLEEASALSSGQQWYFSLQVVLMEHA